MKRLLIASLVVCAAGSTAVGAGSRQQSWTERVAAVLGRGGTVPSDVRIRAAREVFSSVSVVNGGGTEVAGMEADEVGEGVVAVANALGSPRAGTLVNEDGSGLVAVANTAGDPNFAIHGNLGLITSGADLAEVFPAPANIEPGSVLAIDPARPGAMAIAREPYDRRVAGVASGARDYRPGITLGVRRDSTGVTMTLSGTVYCRLTNANGAIRAGDLLTTSAVAGHAMRVTDYPAAQGAIVGKALEDFDGKSGLALILASLN